MSIGTIMVDVEKKVEVGVEDALKLLHIVENKVSTVAPGALAALGVLAAATEKSLNDAASAATNPLNITIDVSLVADFKAEWSAVKATLATLGLKV